MAAIERKEIEVGQMTFDGVRAMLAEDGTVTVPNEDESDEPITVGQLKRDGSKWVAVRDGDRKGQAFPRRKDALAYLVTRT